MNYLSQLQLKRTNYKELFILLFQILIFSTEANLISPKTKKKTDFIFHYFVMKTKIHMMKIVDFFLFRLNLDFVNCNVHMMKILKLDINIKYKDRITATQ